MATEFRVLCEFGSSSVTSGGSYKEDKIYVSFRKSNLLHVLCGDAISNIYRFSHELVWSASDAKTLMAATCDGRIWKIPLHPFGEREIVLEDIIRDIDEQGLVAVEENVSCFVVTEAFLATLKRCQYTQCLSVYDRVKNTTDFHKTARLQLHFTNDKKLTDRNTCNDVTDIDDVTHINDVTDIVINPLLCLSPDSHEPLLGMKSIDCRLFSSLCGLDDGNNMAVILYGDGEGVVRCIAVSDPVAKVAVADNDSDSDFEWGMQTDPPVVCCIDQPTQSLHVAFLPTEGTPSVTQSYNSVVIVGCLGRIMLITADEGRHLVFHEYNVDSPVTTSCVVASHWLIHATKSDTYASSLVQTEDERMLMREQVLLTPSMGQEVPQQKREISYRFALQSIPLSLTHAMWIYPIGGSMSASCIALTQSQCLYQFECQTKATVESVKRVSARASERKLKEVLASMKAMSNDMQHVDSEKTRVDAAIRDVSVSMNILCDFLDIQRREAAPDTAPLDISVTPVVRDKGLPGCETNIKCRVHNTSSHELPTGWFLVVSIHHLPRSPSVPLSSPGMHSLSIPCVTHSFSLKSLKSLMFAEFEISLPEWSRQSLVPMNVKCCLHYNAFSLVDSLSPSCVGVPDVSACTILVETMQLDVLDFVRPHTRLMPLPVPQDISQTTSNIQDLLHQLQAHKSDTIKATTVEQSEALHASTAAIKVTNLLVSRLSPMLTSTVDCSDSIPKGPSVLLHRLLEQNSLCCEMNLKSFGKHVSVKLLTPFNVCVDLQAMYVEKAQLGQSVTLGKVPKDVELTISSYDDETLESVTAAVMARFRSNTKKLHPSSRPIMSVVDAQKAFNQVQMIWAEASSLRTTCRHEHTTELDVRTQIAELHKKLRDIRLPLL